MFANSSSMALVDLIFEIQPASKIFESHHCLQVAKLRTLELGFGRIIGLCFSKHTRLDPGFGFGL